MFARGPVSTELDFLASPVCLHDDVTTDPVEDSQLDLYFDTPPPVHGGFQLEQTYGCLECALAKYILAHSQATVPAQPAGDAPSTIQYTGDPVNVSTGTLTESFTDISLPGPGIPFQLLRSYNSRDTTSGVMGPGWTNALVASLSIDGSGNVTYRSGDGQQVKFTKNGTNYIGRTDLVLKKPTGSTYTITTPDQRVLTFDTSGNLTQAKSRFGPATTFSYSGGQLTGVTDSAGRSITLSYTSGKLTSVTLPDSRHVDYSYTSGRLTGVTDLRGKSWTLAYDANGFLESIEDPLGHFPLRATYDSQGRVLTQQDGEGNETDYAYTSDGTYDITTVSPPNRGDYIYKSIKNLLLSETDPLDRTTSYTYDTEFRVVAVTDPRGTTTKYEYDQRGNLVKETRPAPISSTRSWTYNATNDVLTAKDWRGHTTTNAYAASADLRLPGGPAADGHRPAQRRDDLQVLHGQRRQAGPSQVDPKRALEDDQLRLRLGRQPRSITTPLGNQTTMTYDSSGRRLTLVDPRGNLMGADPNDFKTTWAYDDGDNLLSVTNARGNDISYTYDDAGRRQTMVTPDGTTDYDYDNADRLTLTADPRSGEEARTYEAGGELASLETPTGATTTYAYDGAGQLTSLVEPRGNTAGATASDYTWTYTYDDAGNRLTEAHPDAGTTTYTYDAINRVTSIEDPLSDITTIDYDDNGNVTKRTDELGHHRDYSYDSLDRLTTLTDERGKATTYDYFATGELEGGHHRSGEEDQLHARRRRPHRHHGRSSRKRGRRHPSRLYLELRLRRSREPGLRHRPALRPDPVQLRRHQRSPHRRRRQHAHDHLHLRRDEPAGDGDRAGHADGDDHLHL